VDRGTKVVVLGEVNDTERVGTVLDELLIAIRKGHTPTPEDVAYALRQSNGNGTKNLGAVLGEVPAALRRDIAIKPRTHGQKLLLDAISSHEAVIVTGPAGTGKTFLAMAAALSALLNKEVDRIVLTRPAVEAGENLGFLPGDLMEKVNPYLRPLYDALYAIVDTVQARKLFDRDQIEVAPLAYMRGRTLSRCFAILDEAQNTTNEQMKMFLTRLGEGSRAIITGDLTQIDLPRGTRSGLVEARRILSQTEGIAVIDLTVNDIVRHRLVQNIVAAYEADQQAALPAPAERRETAE
jgi:phosphate starvation-inducible PhoH-like protein